VIDVARRALCATLAVAVVLTAFGATPAEGTTDRPPVAEAGTVVAEPLLFLGDSLCVGARDHGGGLTGALRSVGWEPEYICGSGEGLVWGISEVRDLESVPATVVVALGTNPSSRDPEFEGLAVDLREELTARGAQRILWVDFASERRPYDDKNAVLHDLARGAGDGLVRWSVLVHQHPEWFRSDGLHYQETGMRQWSRRIADETTRLRLDSVPGLDAAIDLVTSSFDVGRIAG
jgi:hypothetical protein